MDEEIVERDNIDSYMLGPELSFLRLNTLSSSPSNRNQEISLHILRNVLDVLVQNLQHLLKDHTCIFETFFVLEAI